MTEIANKNKIIPVVQDKYLNDIGFRTLIQKSTVFQHLKEELKSAVKISMTGITNLIVNHEDSVLVDDFLKECFKLEELYNNTYDIDAVELQAGSPGKGYSTKYIDELIYGTFDTKIDPDSGVPVVETDPLTGKRKRRPDGFVTRREVIKGEFKDKTLIIKNIDYSLDFCKDTPGVVDPRSSWIFDNFRKTNVKRGCRLLIVTNKKIVLPFSTRTIELSPVSELEANHVIDSFIRLYNRYEYEIVFTKSQMEQMVRKISGLTYTLAADSIGYSFSASESPKGSKKINSSLVLKHLREKINKGFMENGHGLSHLVSRPWEDYICPESSNFTYDVKKILRDFTEIARLKASEEENIKNGIDETETVKTIEAIQHRIPHRIVLYGKGGVGKSAFPVHLAGLLEFDIWDFNINATHSKWIGEGSKQMREDLNKISAASHVIIRIDEYDRAIGAAGESGQGMHEAHKQVESEFMNWLQNADENNLFIKNNIILVLTTNHKDNITGPLLRSGRSDLVIDIDNFDSKSMKEAFTTCSRRMKNKGMKVLGFNDSQEDLQKAINDLDVEQLSEIATLKGFTVRDIETLISEMAAHSYFYKISGGKDGFAWTTENFVEVLNNSEGSIKDDTTGELVLGDRYVFQQREKGKNNIQKENKTITNPSKLGGFEEK
jgi:hypothetical protein